MDAGRRGGTADAKNNVVPRRQRGSACLPPARRLASSRHVIIQKHRPDINTCPWPDEDPLHTAESTSGWRCTRKREPKLEQKRLRSCGQKLPRITAESAIGQSTRPCSSCRSPSACAMCFRSKITSWPRSKEDNNHLPTPTLTPLPQMFCNPC